jgi:RHS repeat-associated protein
VVEYAYDTWGKKVSTTGSLAGTLGLFQPFRYRGYVYDFETGFYYLQSRYYDPTTGRFISADILLSTGQGVLGHNCYAYCLDNPASLADYTGFDPVLVIGGVAISLETIIIVCALIVLLGYYVAQNDYIVKELRISIGELIDKQNLSVCIFFTFL